MPPIVVTVIEAIVRGLLQNFSGQLFAEGSISAEDTKEITGAVVLIVTVAWSIYSKRRAQQKAKAQTEFALVQPQGTTPAEFAEKTKTMPVDDMKARVEAFFKRYGIDPESPRRETPKGDR